MSVTLRQIQTPDQRLDLRGITPDRLGNMAAQDIERLPLSVGNRRYPLREMFDVVVSDDGDTTVRLHTMDHRVDHVGSGMQGGRLRVYGDVGDRVATGMLEGNVTIEGDAGAFCGSGIRGGRLHVLGHVGDHLASPPPGETRGQQGGIVRVEGQAGAFAGERMRRGMLLIEGNAGDYLGHRMIAGTIFCGGRSGQLTGLSMRRGTLLLRQMPESLPSTIADNGRQSLPFLTLLLRELGRLLGSTDPLGNGERAMRRYVGDLANDGRGEVILLS